MSEVQSIAALLCALGAALLCAALVSPLSQRAGVPALLLFLGLGMLAGSEGVGGVPFENYGSAFRIGTAALVLILFDGGLNTSRAVFRQALARASLLATVSVLITAGLVAAAGVALGLSLPISLLIGAVVSSTDAAAVFGILHSGGLHLKRSTSATLEVESGLNDPMAVFLTVATTEALLGAPLSAAGLAFSFARELAVGSAAGVALGFIGRFVLRTVELPAAGLYPALTLALAFLSFGIAALFGGSGFLAVYLTAVVLASGPLPYRAGVRRVHDALAWLAQILMFVLLGLLVFPSRLVPVAGVGLALALALAFFARPLAVLPALLFSRLPWNERLFVSWVGLRGAVPVILAAYPVLRGVAAGDQIFHLVFFVVLLNSLIPGATVGWLARRMGLATHNPPPPNASVELVSLRDLAGEFAWFFVTPASAVAKVPLRELPLPDGCVVTLVVRGSQVIAPRGHTELDPGDQVCIFFTAGCGPLLGLLFGAEPEAAEG
jgi:cell volume regulation protein A